MYLNARIVLKCYRLVPFPLSVCPRLALALLVDPHPLTSLLPLSSP